ncbi:MAG TPA: hypothetical protein VN666_16655 [Nitrospira sp.]|nr:hypothetical protein [Nitrospira sp.]
MITLRTEYGIMLAGLVLSLGIQGCSAWDPGHQSRVLCIVKGMGVCIHGGSALASDHPSTPEVSKGTDLTPRPTRTDSGGGVIPHKQVDQHDPAPEQY